MPRPRHADRRAAAGLLAAAAAFAAAEWAAGLLIGRFFAWGRAEALLFLAFRPWLLLAAALLAAHRDWRRRVVFYALALAAAGFAESLFLLALGGDPWREMLRGIAAGAVLALVLDLLVQLGTRMGGRAGRAAAAALVAALLAVPGALSPYEALALGPTAPRPAAERPPLLLVTGLPIVWGETGPFDPASRPSASFQALEREFAVAPIDHLDEAALSGASLMLLAQPRWLTPAELVALDGWVRGGGRVLILADPALRWPSGLPPGDARRPPPAATLEPLLAHWRLRLAPSPDRRVVQADLSGRRLVMAAPGRFSSGGAGCAVEAPFLARCRIGSGAAILVADADLLHDGLWVGPGERGAERHARSSDNLLLVAGWLDRLAGVERRRADRPVAWAAADAPRRRALLLGAIPLLMLLAAALALAFAPRPTHLSTGGHAEQG